MTWDPTLRLVTIVEAARSIDRPASTIRRWISEGRLAPIAYQGRQALYLEAHVLQVDADTHRRRGPLSPPNGTMRPPREL